MEVSITLDPDVRIAAEQLCRSRGIGLGQAVNELARRGLTMPKPSSRPFVQTRYDMGDR